MTTSEPMRPEEPVTSSFTLVIYERNRGGRELLILRYFVLRVPRRWEVDTDGLGGPTVIGEDDYGFHADFIQAGLNFTNAGGERIGFVQAGNDNGEKRAHKV